MCGKFFPGGGSFFLGGYILKLAFSYDKALPCIVQEALNCSLTLERLVGHICPMFYSCIYYNNITKNHILISANFSLDNCVHITKKTLCNSSSLSRIWQLYSVKFRICGVVELLSKYQLKIIYYCKLYSIVSQPFFSLLFNFSGGGGQAQKIAEKMIFSTKK